MKNPIFKEYYSHESADCYKINLPWSEYKEEKVVLCKASEGYEYARTLATGLLLRHFVKAVEIENKEPQSLSDPRD